MKIANSTGVFALRSERDEPIETAGRQERNGFAMAMPGLRR
jgi:hypothetical protein